MASDCRLSLLGNLFTFHIKSFKLSLLLFVVVSTSVSVCVGINFNCDAVTAAKKCRCERGNELGWETLCPGGLLEIYPIALNVLPLQKHPGQVRLQVRCIPNVDNFPWELIAGLDLGKEDQGFRVTVLEISYCSPQSVTDGFLGFFKQININGSDIEDLAFISRPKVSISLPQNFLNEMPNLTTLDLSNNKLRTFPNLGSLEKLKTLNLKYNELVNVPRDAFPNNKNLTQIFLESNALTKVEKAVFPDKIQLIDLKDNNISTLTFESFANLKNLRALYLDNNPLDNFEVNTFNDLLELKELSLKNVQLKEFPSLRNLFKLEELTVSRPRRVNLAYADDRATTTFLPDGEGALTTISPPEEIMLNVELNNLPNLRKLQLVSLDLLQFPVLNNLSNLTELYLSLNKLESFPPKYLSHLPNLRILDLSRNYLSELNPPGVNGIQVLKLHDNKLSTASLNATFFGQSSELTHLILSSNKIDSILDETFASLMKLTELDLSNNEISFHNGKKYILAESELPNVGSNQSPLRNNLKLQKLLLSRNRIDTIYEDWRFLMASLSLLDLRNNAFTYLTANDFSFTQEKIRVDLRSNNITRIDMESAMLFLDQPIDSDANQEYQNTVNIILGNNPLDCDCQAYYLKKFHSNTYKMITQDLVCATPENLNGENFNAVTDKDFQCSIKLGCPEDCECWQRSADSTILVDCSNRNLSSSKLGLPQLSNDDIVRQLRTSIKNWKLDLNLSGNKISELNTSYIATLSPHIRMVDLSDNQLNSLSFLDILDDNNNVTNFELANNPFPCEDCTYFQNQWRLFTSRLDVDNMTCIFKGDPDPHYLKSLGDFEVICPRILFSTELRVLVIVASLLLAVLVFVVAAYIRHGWAIRAFLYSKGLGCCLCCDSMDDDEDKIYDAFVSYSHKDEDWVLNELMKRLEERDGFKLCVHFRDWIPGDFISEQIVRSVDQSRRTVIVLSKHFVESIWSRLEFKTAHSQAINDKTNRLILILMGDELTDDDIKDEDLRLYMKMNTYLKWNDPWFWHKLKYALPHKKNDMEENRNILRKREQRERAIKLDKLKAKIEQNV